MQHKIPNWGRMCVCGTKKKKFFSGWAWWLIPVIPASQEAEMGGSRFEASLNRK
jgi:hypothetical protein